MQAFAKNRNTQSTPAKSQENGPFFGVQAKLKTGQKGDQYEVEADSVAEKVVNKTTGKESNSFFTPAAPAVQMQQEPSIAQSITPHVQLKEAEDEAVQSKEDDELQKQEEEETAQMKQEEEIQQKEENEESLQAKEDEEIQKQEEEESIQSKEDDEEVQMLKISNKTKKPNISKPLRASKGSGQTLPNATKSKMESGFGTDLSDVRVHTDTAAAKMNQDLGAKAFTNGKDIYFNEGNFKPDTKEGDTLLAHELTHTIQQGAVAADKKPQAEKKTNAANANAPKQSGQESLPSGESQKNIKAKPGKEAIKLPEEGKNAKEKSAGDKESKEEQTFSTPRSPEDDPNFLAAQQQIENRATEQQTTQEASAASSAAQSASPVPANERQGGAQASQVEAMDEQEAGTFDAAAFKAQLMERIERMQLPANEEQADDFENHNNIDEITADGTQMASAERQNAAGPIEQATTAEPNTEAVPQREVTALPDPAIGNIPAPVPAAQAMPPRRAESEVSQPLQENMQSVDQQMQDNEVTDEMLANSNEPSFTGALASRDEAREHTEQAPQSFRQQESNTLASSQQSAANASSQGLQEMHNSRSGVLNQVTQQQQGTSTQDSAERERISAEINAIYEATKVDVETILASLDEQVTMKFTAAAERAKGIFESHVEKEMDAYKDERYSGLGGAVTWVGDAFTGLPDEVNEFFVEGKAKYIKAMDGELTSISQYIAQKLTEAQQRIALGKNQINEYVGSLPENLQSIGQDAAGEIQSKFDELTDSVNSKQDELIDSLASQYQENLAAVDARIEEMQAANRGLIDMAMDLVVGVIQTIIEIKNMLTNLLSAAISAIGAIITDPIGFLNNLFTGVKDGFLNFGKNILKHLINGLVTWLTGALGPMGITIPEDIFSLKGIFSLVLQVLGLTWDYMRQKAVKLLGEPVVQALEVGFEIFQIIRTEGIAGVWEYLKDQFNDLKETVIEAIQDMIITQVVDAGIKWVLGLMSPAGAFVKAAMMIIDIVKFFIERGSQIIALVNAFIDGIKAVASGNVTAIATKIEEALGKAVPVIIGFLASLLGLSGLARKVQNLIGKIRKRIDKAIDKLILKAKKAFKGLVKKGKAAAGRVLSWIRKKVKFTLSNGEEHKIFFKEKGNKYELTIRSTEMPYESFINSIDISSDPTLGPKKVEALNHAEEIDRLSAESASNTNKDNSEVISAKMQLLVALTSKLMEANKGTIENSRPVWGSEFNGTFGTSMRIDFLSTKKSSGSSADSKLYNTQYRHLDKRKGESGSRPYYVRGHLLNADFHGPGNEWKNLTPLTYSANSLHKTRVEGKIREKMVNGKTAFRYMLQVNYGRGLNQSLIDEVIASGKPKAAEVAEIIKMEQYVPTSIQPNVKQIDKDGEIVQGGLTIAENIPNTIKQNSYEDYTNLGSDKPDPVSINTANKETLKTIPNITSDEVAKILEKRTFRGRVSMSTKTEIPLSKIETWYDNEYISFN